MAVVFPYLPRQPEELSVYFALLFAADSFPRRFHHGGAIAVGSGDAPEESAVCHITVRAFHSGTGGRQLLYQSLNHTLVFFSLSVIGNSH